MSKFNAAAVADKLARYYAANRTPSLHEQIAAPEVWAVVEQMKADGMSLKDIATGLVEAGIDGTAGSIRAYLSKISVAKAGPAHAPATAEAA